MPLHNLKGEMEMAPFEFIKFYQTQVGLVDKIWWYFYSVTIAALSFIVLSEKAIKGKYEITIITLGYVVFALGSALSLWYGQAELCFFAKQAKNKNCNIPLNPFEPWQVVIFLAAIAIAAVISIIVMYRYRSKAKNSSDITGSPTQSQQVP